MNRNIIFILLIFLFSNCAFSQLNGPNRAQTISNIFQIPIQTLTAISNVVQNTRPISQIVAQRWRPFQQAQGGGFPPQNFGPQTFPQQGSFGPQTFPQTFYNRFPSRPARIAGLYTALDGSGFRI